MPKTRTVIAVEGLPLTEDLFTIPSREAIESLIADFEETDQKLILEFTSSGKACAVLYSDLSADCEEHAKFLREQQVKFSISSKKD